jgi:hypothetical protein
MKRRSFLRLIGAAPIAAPVIAQEAAGKMGLQAIGTAYAGMELSGTADYNPVKEAVSPVNEGEWVRSEIAQFFSEPQRRNRRESIGSNITRLDPDLASMRSVSPSFAYSRQVDRTMARAERRETSWMRERAKVLGIPWLWK